MQDIDAIKVHFNPEQLQILNACLAFIMFGVALDLRLFHFKEVIRKPRALLLGMTSQLIGLPLVTLGLIYLLHPPASLAMGMLLVAVCPGGNVSNYATHLAGANTALSVTMTSFSTLLAALSTPLLFAQLTTWMPYDLTGKELNVDISDMVLSIIQLIIVPLIAGLIFQRIFPELTRRVLGPIQRLSMVIFLGFVVFAIHGNFNNIVRYLHLVFLLVALHNALALSFGYFWSKLNKLPERDARTIAIETGIQNSGLGLILIFNFFNGLGGMAMIAAWWGVWHLISAFALAIFWRKTAPKPRMEKV